jgi:murein L,D-transpeptidase YcbB/YkuD
MSRTMITTFIILSLLASGCDNHNPASAENKPPQVDEKVITRDISINSGNAYNDLFLDSNDVQKFIAEEKLSDTLATAIRSFYNVRNFEYAWFSSSGLIEQSLSFRSLYKTEHEPDLFNKTLEARLDRLRIDRDSSVSARDASTIKTEIQLSLQFIRYARQHFKDMGISQSALGTFIPAKKKDILDLANEVLAADNISNKNYAAFNESYGLLKSKLQQYTTIAKNGGWPILATTAKKYRLGIVSPDIILLKKRLQITGELQGQDTTESFDVDLQNAIKTYQGNHGYKPTGEVNATLLKDLNVPVLARIQQIMLNMQRMRWMPDRSTGLLIKVNIPEFVVYVDSGKKTLIKMDVVVGAEGHNTTMFSGNLNQVVFSPYWNIPSSIARKEVLPGLRRDRNYLKKRNMESAGNGNFRQKPGPRNALGKVKFLFPNSFSIYMHDTPQKGFFDRDKRSLSHGCIRLSDARKMAIYLLRNYPEWTVGKIDSAMNSGHELFVKLKPTVPVIITYYTAWVDERGALHFAGDLYQHDKMMAQKMFTNPQ